MSVSLHARPFVGVFQSQFLPGLSTFDNNSHQNGSKNGETAPRPGTGYPHEGPSVGFERRKESAVDATGLDGIQGASKVEPGRVQGLGSRV